MVTIDEMQMLLESVAEEFPDEFFRELNGGIGLQQELKRSPYARGDDLFILGEYHHDRMGRYIYIYYGSFMRAFGHLNRNALRRQLYKTVSHEFTHHMESLAGERGLEIKDEENIERYQMRTTQRDIDDGDITDRDFEREDVE